MTSRSLGNSPQTYARIGGVLYLFIIVAALFAESYVRGSLIVHDPDITAANILQSETLFRLGLAGEMLTCVCDVAVALILYVLLKPVSRNLALLAAFFRLTFIAVYGAAKLFEVAALALLNRPDYLKALGPQQVHVLAHALLRAHSYGYGVSLLFFGVCTILFGRLISRSGYLPRLLGVLLWIAGWAYVVFSLAQMLSPAFTSRVLFPWILLPGFFGELALALWLTVKGVDLPKWQEKTVGVI